MASQFAEIKEGDCRDVVASIPDAVFDSIVTDPPYGLKFMGKGWDHGVPSVEFWREFLRVCKPGAHLLAFGGTRTFHRLMVAIEDAGWELRDTIMWTYGSGNPKGGNVSKLIDKAAGATPVVLGVSPNWRESKRDREQFGSMEVRGANAGLLTAPSTDAARQWEDWHTGLKPAWEPIVVARKRLIGTVAENVLAHGTGALNIGAGRVPVVDAAYARNCSGNRGFAGTRESDRSTNIRQGGGSASAVGRWPANLIHDGSDEVVALFPVKSDGSAARFFYCAKTSPAERNAGVADGNPHPTVKPQALMRYLCKLVTQPGGVILDPFVGSGSTGVAAVAEGFQFLGIERDADSAKTARERLANAQR